MTYARPRYISRPHNAGPKYDSRFWRDEIGRIELGIPYGPYLDLRDFNDLGHGHDDTDELNRAFRQGAGYPVYFPPPSFGSYNISAELALQSGASYSGTATLKAIDGSNITFGMFYGVGVENVTISDGLTFDANADQTGANYGVWLQGGSNNRIGEITVHDTINAGACILDEADFIANGPQFTDCGRTGVTDNHGIMVGSITATGLLNPQLNNVRVLRAFRKGITSFSFGVGIVRNLKIAGGWSMDNGLGGYYLAAADIAYPTVGVTLTNLLATGNYTNYFLERLENVTGSDLIASDATGDCGFNMVAISRAVLSSVVSDGSDANGMLVSGCDHVTVNGVALNKPSRVGPGGYSGLKVLDSTDCQFIGGSIADADVNQPYAIQEVGTSDRNLFQSVSLANPFVSLVATVGASTQVLTCPGYNPVGASSAVVGASPWTYTAGTTPLTLFLHSGTVSNVSVDGTTVATAAPCMVPLNAHQSAVVTYTVAPTAVVNIQ